MNSKNIFQNIQYVVVGSIVALALSYGVQAASFKTPSGTPPAGNTPTPLNVGLTDQVKQGGLSVTTFISRANAELDGTTYFGGVLHADATNPGNLIAFGGTDPKGIVRSVAFAISGGFQNTGSLASTPLSNTKLSPVCADPNGKLILCAASDMCTNITGTQTTVPSGYVRNGDGTCNRALKRFYSVNTTDITAENFSNNVVDSKVTYHIPGQKTGYPLVAIFGLNNDFPYGWRIDDIANVKDTGFKSGNITSLSQAGGTALISPAEAGSYNFKISSQGKLGIQGKFASDANYIGVDFYMRIQHTSSADQWIRLDNETSKNVNGTPHEPYPVSDKTSTDFGVFFDGDSNQVNPFFGLNFGGTGDKYFYIPYSFDFQKTITLNQGDIVNVYAFVYGISTTGGNGYGGDWASTVGSVVSGSLHDSPNNFHYSISTPYQGTVIDIVETPK